MFHYLIDPETGLIHEPEGFWIDLVTLECTEFEVCPETVHERCVKVQC